MAPLSKASKRRCRNSVTTDSCPQICASYRVVATQFARRAAAHDLARLEHVGPMRDRECEVGVLLDDQLRERVGAIQSSEPFEQAADDERRQPERGFIE